MPSLQTSYSKEIAKELGKIAVYLPGEEITVGDIIKFPYGKKLFKSSPTGTFTRVTNLKNLGITYDEPKESVTPDSYQFTSKDSVDIHFNVDAKLGSSITDFPKGESGVKISLSEEGAIFFYAIDCKKRELLDIPALQNQINDQGKTLVWDDTFLVTSVTIANKALVIQSNSKSSELILGGDIKGLQGSKAIELDVQSKIHIKKQRGNVFIKNWSDDVTVFMDVVRFKKKVFGRKKSHLTEEPFLDNDPSLSSIELEVVNIGEVINAKL
ncbi:hypothetical protein SAMN04487765_1689 [Tenacibaculum sp. MAR_2010_89]|uniref:hypothetical protein n=1 Tax=Tenacibaculum sp. MAR_2010_89 TaxID=1250198 RepID=UPI00089C7841|nr:hypothetical protein [Tenacibaculum sp. MAR_2010_89]SEE18592.1 hypothetical protein SAMN04487765_1689 [Tenacibaculum sp. MAR_2010_89]